jgi:hypothetical protein
LGKWFIHEAAAVQARRQKQNMRPGILFSSGSGGAALKSMLGQVTDTMESSFPKSYKNGMIYGLQWYGADDDSGKPISPVVFLGQ